MFPSIGFMPQDCLYMGYFTKILLVLEMGKIMCFVVFCVRLQCIGFLKNLIKPLLNFHYTEQWASSGIMCLFNKYFPHILNNFCSVSHMCTQNPA